MSLAFERVERGETGAGEVLCISSNTRHGMGREREEHPVSLFTKSNFNDIKNKNIIPFFFSLFEFSKKKT